MYVKKEATMRIAYSCAGEGLGHAVRTSVIGPLLERRHRIVYFAPSTVEAFLRSKMGNRKFEGIPHFAFEKRGEKVLILASLIRSIPAMLRLSYTILLFARRLRELRIDAVISDFEPILPRAARLLGIPVFQLNHPGIVQRVERAHPLRWLTSFASRVLEGPWHERIHISFYHGDVGPILRREIFRHPTKDGGFILLNLKPSYRPAIIPILDRLGKAYRLFPNKDEVFEEAFASCSCVISSAGHQIIAESIALNKPILVIPQRGQWEQRLNAEMIALTGKGMATSMKRLEGDLRVFLGKLEAYRGHALPSRFDVSDNSAKIARRIEKFLAGYCARRRGWTIRGAGASYTIRAKTVAPRRAS